MLSGKRLSTLYYSSVLLSIPGDQSSYWPRCETSSRQWRTTQRKQLTVWLTPKAKTSGNVCFMVVTEVVILAAHILAALYFRKPSNRNPT